MFQLIMKDIIVQKRERTSLVLLILCLCIAWILPYNPGFAAIQLLVGVYLMVVYANAFDYKYNAEIMLNSLPLARKQIVVAKYLAAIILGFLMVVVSLSVSLVLGKLEIAAVDEINAQVAGRYIMLAFIFISLYLSIFFPLNFKLGYMKSRWVNFFALFIIFGTVGFIGSAGVNVPKYGESAFKETMLQQLLNFMAGNQNILFYVVFFGAGMLLLYISSLLSISIYNKKEF